MIITQLHITNFRGVRSMRLDDLTMATIMLGPNGAGKTTALDALRVALCGQTYDAAGKRIANPDLIGTHGKQAEIAIGIEHADKAFTVTFTLKPTGAKLLCRDDKDFDVFPEAQGINQTRAALCGFLGVKDARHLECALNPRAFLLGPEIGGMLADLCGSGITKEQIEAHAGTHKDALAALCRASGLALDASNLAMIGKAAEERRKSVKKEIAGDEKHIASLGGIEQPTDNKGEPIAVSRIGEFETLLADLQRKRDDLFAQEGRAKAVIEHAEEYDRKRGELTAKIEAMEKAVESAKAEKEKTDAAYHEICQAIERARKIHRDIRDKQHSAVAQVDRAREALETLTGEDSDACPTCGRKYTEKLKTKLIGPLEEALHAAHLEDDKLKASYEDASKKLVAIEEDYTKIATAAREQEQAVFSAEKDLAAPQSQLSEIPDTSTLPDPEAIAANIETVTSRIENGEAKLESLRQWKALKKTEQNLADAQAELAHLEWMVAQFRDGEFAKSVLADSKGEFETKLNEVLEPYDYILRVVIEGKTVTVEMRKQGIGAAFVPLAQCSKAELVLAGWAIASAFGDAAPVALDDLDALYGPTKTKFLHALRDRSQAAPVFIAGAWTLSDCNLDPIRQFLAPATVHWIDRESKAEARKGAA